VIAIANDPVARRGDQLDEIWWRGKQWAVTAYGIECLDGTYPIKADRLLQDMPGYSWPQHIAEKGWDVAEFTTAWMVAILMHGRKDVRAVCKRIAVP
jgi:hypothetical protein